MPVANEAPPLDTAYQLTVPALDVAPKTTKPGPQVLPGVVLVMVGIVFTVAATNSLGLDVQPFKVELT